MKDPQARRPAPVRRQRSPDAARKALRLVLSACALLAVLLSCVEPAGAQPGSRVVLLLVASVDAVTFNRVLDGPRWSELRSGGALAALNVAAPGPARFSSAYLSMGAGQRLPAPRLGGGVRQPDPRPEGSPAHFRAMQGIWLTLADRNDARPGALGEACRQGGRRVAYLGIAVDGAPPRGYLVAADAGGSVPLARAPRGDSPPEWAADAAELLPRADLLVVDLAPRAGLWMRGGAELRAEHALAVAAELTASLDPSRDLLLLASPDGTLSSIGPHLAPALLWGRAWAGRSVRSATTRTEGLLSNVDIAPTALAHLGLEVPGELEGHVAAPAGYPGQARSLALHSHANREAMLPGLFTWGGLCLAAVAFATFALLRPAPAGRVRLARFLLALMTAYPVAMLLVALHPAPTKGELLGLTPVIALAVAGACTLLARRVPALVLVLLFTVAVCLADLFLLHRLLARNLMSDFANIGARFYGIGNEYLGVMEGAALAAPFWLAARAEQREGTVRPRPGWWIAAGTLWLVMLVAVGAPGMGADFGGAVALTLACLVAAGLAWSAYTGERLPLGWIALAVLAAGGVGIGLVLFDLSRPPELRTHVGELAARALQTGPAGLFEMAGRKAMLNVRMAFTPYFVGGVLAAAPILGLWHYRLGGPTRALLARQPLLRAGFQASIVGGITALLLNDTGVIAWVMATACGLLMLLDELLGARKT